MSQQTASGPDATTSAPGLAGVLARAVARGDLTPDTAQAILEAEASRDPIAVVQGPRDRSLMAEVLGYVGAVLAMVAVLIVVAQFWQDLAPWARVALPALAAVAFALANLAIGTARPVTARIASLASTLAVVATATTVGIASVEWLDLSGSAIVLLVSSASAVVAGAFWYRRRGSLEQATAFVAIAFATASSVATVDRSLVVWMGLALWGLGAAWGTLAWGRVVTPSRIAYFLAAGACLLGPSMLSGAGPRGALLLGLATAFAIIAAGVFLDRREPVVLAVLGLFGYLPATVFEFFGDALGAPVALLITGVVLIAFSIGLTRIGPFGPRDPELTP